MERESRPRRPQASPRGLLRPLRRARLDRNVVVEFFFTFSRFEYALKRAGFVKSNRQGYAEADWEKFGMSIQESYNPDESPDFVEAVNFLLSNPPKRQIVEPDGSLGWEEVKVEQTRKDIGWLLILVRRVRNNLFHGGKYPYLPVPEPARDTKLLNSSREVLRTCLDWNPRLRSYFLSDLDA